jgi:hypothetical protein
MLLPKYKNKNNFTDCYREDDFGIDAQRHFFATTHSKAVLHGTGGTINRLRRKAVCTTLIRSTPRQQINFMSGLL